MKNSLTKYAETVLDNYPITLEYIKETIVKEALHTSTLLAIERLLEIVEFENKNIIKSRSRKFDPKWIKILAYILDIQSANCNDIEHWRKGVNRSVFADLKCNDFSVMKHWELIEKADVRGNWRITSKGIGFLLGFPGYRYIAPAVRQLGGIKNNYQKESGAITASELLPNKESFITRWNDGCKLFNTLKREGL